MSRNLDRMMGGAEEGEEHLEVTNHLHLNPSIVPDQKSVLLENCLQPLIDCSVFLQE